MADSPDIRELFAAHGLRWTKQREDIYSALAVCKTHPTAEDLFQLVHSTSEPAGMSLATVYNTLEALTQAGLCRRLTTAAADGAARFDADMSNHAHVILPSGDVRDLPADLSAEVLGHLPPDLLKRIEERVGIRIARASVEFTCHVR